MIIVGEIFNMPNDIIYLAGVKRSNFNFQFPSNFQLYIGRDLYKEIKIEGVILNNNYFIDDHFDKITVWAYGHLDKKLIGDKFDAFLMLVNR